MNKDLKKMSRSELLEILISLVEENDKLTKELEKCREELNNREIAVNNAGSLAQAALQLNRVFEAADEAARQYLENIKAPGRFVASDLPPVQPERTVSVESKTQIEAAASEKTNEKLELDELIAEARLKREKMLREAESHWQEALKKSRTSYKDN